MQPASHDARTQLILTVIAIAIGGVVFALTEDFVIGAGIGAVVFAVARQALKIWGYKDEQQSAGGISQTD
jgi:hypothetical protein